MSRRKLREHLFKLVFLYAFNPEAEIEEQADLYLDGISGITDAEREYLKDRLKAVRGHVGEIDEMLNNTARGWKTSRFNSCDLAVLRVAVYEMRFDDSIPDGVAINEAVGLAKLYGGDESPSFINGILGELSRKE